MKPAPIAAPQPVACSNCNLRELCMPAGLSPQEMARVDRLVTTRRKVRRKAPLFRTGEKFQALYAIRTGVFKTCVIAADGRGQVTGFQMAGEIVGLDGIVDDEHTCDAVALEDSEVCVLPFERIGELSREVGGLQRHLHRVMSREIVREHGVMLLLGSMRAEERLAAFLLNLVQRLQARGFSPSELLLRMTREEIGSYLGLQLETVSRSFSHFAAQGILEVHHRHVKIVDVERLGAAMAQPAGDFQAHRAGPAVVSSAVGAPARQLRRPSPTSASPLSQHGGIRVAKEIPMNKDHVKGATNEATGEIKQKVGKLTGDKSLEVKGHARELKGKLQQRVGDAKDDVRAERELDNLEKDRDLDN